MSNSNNKINVPEAKAALNKLKMEAASEVGVNLKDGYNGDLTSRQAGQIGGNMVNVMCHVRQTAFMRTSWRERGQVERVIYTYGLAV